MAADAAFDVPACTESTFIPALLEICARERVHLLVPTIDPELLPLARSISAFKTIGTEVAISAPEVIAMARNKIETTRFFQKIGLNTPRTALLGDVQPAAGSWTFPLLAKPIDGSSSTGFQVLPSVAALQAFSPAPGNTVVQQYIAGREYTVNLFFDRNGLRCAIPHLRLETRGGEVSKGVTERLPSLMEAAARIGEALTGKAYGPLCFQAIVSRENIPYLIDLNARFGGGYPLAHRAGARFSQWLIEFVLNRASSANQTWQEGILMVRYDAAMFTSFSGGR